MGLGLESFPMGGGGPTDPPAVVTQPVIDNLNPTVGQTLAFARGTYTNSPTSYTQVWKASGVGIPGETGLTLLLTVENSGGMAITVEETAYNGAGDSGPNTSDPTALVTYAPEWPTPAVITSSGDLAFPIVSDTLTADATSCIGLPVPGLTYAWQRDSVPSSGWVTIGGETLSTYQVQVADLTFILRCVITANNGIGGDVPSNSNETGVVL